MHVRKNETGELLISGKKPHYNLEEEFCDIDDNEDVFMISADDACVELNPSVLSKVNFRK